MGKVLAENHCEIRIAAAINANDAPMPSIKFASVNTLRLVE